MEYSIIKRQRRTRIGELHGEEISMKEGIYRGINQQ